jgi:hypothetical protein
MKIEIKDEEREILNEVLQGAFTTWEIEMHRTRMTSGSRKA